MFKYFKVIVSDLDEVRTRMYVIRAQPMYLRINTKLKPIKDSIKQLPVILS